MPWKDDGQELKPCWSKPVLGIFTLRLTIYNDSFMALYVILLSMVSTFVALLADDVEQTNGFVIFSLTNGPEYHVSQVSKSTSLLVHWVCANGFVCNYLSVLLCLNLLQNSLFDLLSSSKFLLAEFSILLFISAIKDCI